MIFCKAAWRCLPLGQSRPSSNSRPAGAANSERRARHPMSAPRGRRAARRRRRRRRPAAPRHHPPDRATPTPASQRRTPAYSDLSNTIVFIFNPATVFINRTLFTTARRRPRVPSDPRASPPAGTWCESRRVFEHCCSAECGRPWGSGAAGVRTGGGAAGAQPRRRPFKRRPPALHAPRRPSSPRSPARCSREPVSRPPLSVVAERRTSPPPIIMLIIWPFSKFACLSFFTFARKPFIPVLSYPVL